MRAARLALHRLADEQRETTAEDHERETAHDLVRVQADAEERVDQRERAAGQHAGRQREPRVVPRVAGEERAYRTEQHHALDPEVQDARALGEDLPERGQGQRHPEADRTRERDDPHVAVEAAVGEDRRDRVHHAGAASGAASATGSGPIT